MLYTVCQIFDIGSTSPAAVDKTGPMWIQGAMRLVLIFYFAATNQSETIRERLRVLGVHPQKYSYTLITATHSVYFKLMIPWIHQSSRRTLKQSTKWCYIGSTSVGVLSRENNRRAKVKQCQAGQYVQVEPALRVWAKSMLPYAAFSTLVVQCFGNYKDAWIQEHILIDSLQARLNFPCIYKFFKKTAFGPQKIKFKNHVYKIMCKDAQKTWYSGATTIIRPCST